MPMPAAYQPKKMPAHAQHFFNDVGSKDVIKRKTFTSAPRFFHQKFFVALGLLIFLYAGLRLIEHTDKYSDPSRLFNDIHKSVDKLKNIKTNYAYAAGAEKQEKIPNQEDTSSKEPKSNVASKSEATDKPSSDTTEKPNSTGNAPQDKALEHDDKKENAKSVAPDGTAKKEEEEAVFFDPLSITSPNDVKILKALGLRRQEIDKREAELAQKELELSILEKKVTEKVKAMEAISAKVSDELKELDQQEVKKAQSLAKIYSSMKPKEAARIFEGMDMPILLTVVARISERKLAPIIALLSPDKARELTKKLAHKNTSLSQPLKTS
jgi:flagellar motility protein MotE (MotC chaperone)